MVATSKSRFGPFKMVNEKVNLSVSGGGDFTLMIDPNDKPNAYVAYDAWGNSHSILIEQLDKDYYDVSGKLTPYISAEKNEAPMLFERKGWYYLLFGHTCCFCAQGSGALVYVADSPLGDWKSMDTDINPVVKRERTVKAQCNYVISLESKTSGETQYLYTGDMWSTAPDGLKSHDIQYWSPPLEFNDDESPPTIKPMTFVDSFEINVQDTEHLLI
jgi:hypothetical protein